MTSQRDAYAMGSHTGYSIARSNGTMLEDVGAETFIDECLETETSHYRQFSPFEFTAREFNDSRNPDAVWQSYDDGVYKGILKYVKEHPVEASKRGKKPGRKPAKRVAKRASAWYFDPDSRVTGGTRPFYIVSQETPRSNYGVKTIQMQETSTQKGLRTFRPVKF